MEFVLSMLWSRQESGMQQIKEHILHVAFARVSVSVCLSLSLSPFVSLSILSVSFSPCVSFSFTTLPFPLIFPSALGFSSVSFQFPERWGRASLYDC